MEIPAGFKKKYRNRKNTVKELAEYYGVHLSTISRWSILLGISRRGPKPRVKWDDKLLRMLHRLGATHADIGRLCGGATASAAQAHAAKLGLPRRQGSSGDVKGREAERLYALGFNLTRVAAALGSTIGTVRRVLIANGVKLLGKNGSVELSDDPTVAQVMRFHRNNPHLTIAEVSLAFGKKHHDWAGRRIRFAQTGLTDRHRSTKSA
jgi:hypothetical protein